MPNSKGMAPTFLIALRLKPAPISNKVMVSPFLAINTITGVMLCNTGKNVLMSMATTNNKINQGILILFF